MTFPPLLDYFQVCGVFNCFTRKRSMRDKYDNRTMLRTSNDTIISSYLPFFSNCAHLCREMEKSPDSTIKSSQQQQYFTTFTVLVTLLELP